ncbi:MAG: hypothetical protein GF398_08675 [Chitinivibrionales bacterium]|nr:hypothetical protein [Chitinivibrionales bacterium]
MISELFRIFVNHFKSGGPIIMIVIFSVAVIAWHIGLSRILFLNRFARARKKFLNELQKVLNGNGGAAESGLETYDDLLKQIDRDRRQNRVTKESRIRVIFREFLIAAVPQLNCGFSSMNAWISVAPLLGLLGTVTGMIKTFRVITEFGVGNPALTAEGISIALITTQAGLTVAFPAMIFHNFLLNKKNALVSKLFQDGENLVNQIKTIRKEQSKGDKQELTDNV